MTAHETSVGSRVQGQGGAEGQRRGVRPCAPAAGPVPDREVAGAARGLGPADVDLATWDFSVVGRGREPDPLSWERARRAAAHEDHAGHPLRHALEPLRRDVRGRRTGARSSQLVQPKPRRATSSRTPSRASRRTCRSRSSTRGRLAARDARRRRAADARARLARSGSSSRASTSGRAPSGCAASSCSSDRQARVLGALRLPQRRRPLRRSSATVLILGERSRAPDQPSCRWPMTASAVIEAPDLVWRLLATARKGDEPMPVATKTWVPNPPPVLPPLSGRPSGHSLSG